MITASAMIIKLAISLSVIVSISKLPLPLLAYMLELFYTAVSLAKLVLYMLPQLGSL